MNVRRAIGTISLLGALIGTAGGAEPGHQACRCSRNGSRHAACQCCDDYCRKPPPGVPCSLSKHCNDYCSKPLPPVPCGASKHDDCYCRKPLPCVAELPCDLLRCGPPELCWPLPKRCIAPERTKHR
jgi:hypothetical protein